MNSATSPPVLAPHLFRRSFIELNAWERARSLMDEGTFEELLGPFDRMKSPWLPAQGVVPQSDDGVVIARGAIDGCRTVVIAIEGMFQGGIVPDPENRFPRARSGELGLEEGWNLAKHIREVMEEDQPEVRRPIIAIVDVPSQAYGRREELLGIFLACAAAASAYAEARFAGHPVISLVVGNALSGGFLAHGYQANRILAFDDSGVVIHAMGKQAAARVGFELATGFPAATKDSDLDLLIRAPDELKRDLCRRVHIRLSAQVPVRTDVLIETRTGAIPLDEYARGDLQILLRSSNGPKLVYHPWKIVDECCLHIPGTGGTGSTGAGDVTFPSEASCRSAHPG
jgi:hypothetical protein